MRAVLLAALALFAILLASSVHSGEALPVALAEEAEDEMEMNVAAEEEDEAEDESEDEADVEDETEEEAEELDSMLLAVDAATHSEHEQTLAELEEEGDILFEAIALATAEVSGCPQQCAGNAKKEKCMKECRKAETAGAGAPVKNEDCEAVCRKHPKFSPQNNECKKKCEAKKGRKNASDAANGCNTCDVNPATLEACCGGKKGCEVIKKGVIGMRKSNCVAKSATDKVLTEHGLKDRAKGLIPGLVQKAQEFAKTFVIQRKEAVVQDLVDKFVADNVLRLRWRCMTSFERKQGVASALKVNVKKTIGAALGSFVAGQLGGYVGGQLAGVIGAVAGWMPFKAKVADWLIKTAVEKVVGKGSGKAVDSVKDLKTVNSLIDAGIEKHWVVLRRKMDPADTGATESLPQKGC